MNALTLGLIVTGFGALSACSSGDSSPGSTHDAGPGSTSRSDAGGSAKTEPDASSPGTPDASSPGTPDAATAGAEDSGPSSHPVPTPEAGTILGGVSRCPGGFLACDGFETTLDASSWVPYGAPDVFSAQIDAVHAPARGKSSLRLHVIDPTAGEVFAMIQQSKPLPTDAVFVRYFFYYPSVATRLSGWVAKLEGPQGRAWLGLAADGTFEPEASGTFIQDPVTKNGGTYQLPLDRWVCLEWQVHQGTTAKGGADGSVRLLADGVDTGVDMSGFVAAPFDTLWIGFNPNQPPAQFDFWIDEVVVDRAPIGCAR